MKNSQNFVPLEYINALKKRRARVFRRSALGVVAVVVIFVGVMSTSGYANYFVTQSAAAKSYEAARAVVLPSYQSYTLEPVPDPREQLNGDLEEPIEESEEYVEDYYDYSSFEELGCNVLGISISGELGTKTGDSTSDYIRDTLDVYRDNVDVKAILVEVDSGGGSPVAGDEIKTLLDEQTVPVIAQIREIGASAAYMAILSADRIFAHRYADVGSIGVIISFYDYSEQNDKEGIKYDPIKTGLFKDTATGDRPLTSEERKLLQAEIDYIYDGFVSDVALYRGLSISEVKALADGKTWQAHKAVEVGLIDAVGGRPEVTNYIKETIGEEPVVCWQ